MNTPLQELCCGCGTKQGSIGAVFVAGLDLLAHPSLLLVTFAGLPCVIGSCRPHQPVGCWMYAGTWRCCWTLTVMAWTQMMMGPSWVPWWPLTVMGSSLAALPSPGARCLQPSCQTQMRTRRQPDLQHPLQSQSQRLLPLPKQQARMGRMQGGPQRLPQERQRQQQQQRLRAHSSKAARARQKQHLAGAQQWSVPRRGPLQGLHLWPARLCLHQQQLRPS